MALSHAQLVGIAQEYGTPLYVYEADKIEEQYKKLKTAFSGANAKFFLCL